jgi:outer membrane receptor protein involved in Fe transport
MQRKRWYGLFLLLIVPVFLFGQSGKVRGTVVDAKSKEPLIGANVVINGTSLGAGTDVDGAFMILNVPVGTYSLRASYVGYRNVEISNIRVNLNLTTEVNFELPSQEVQLGTVEVVAERPLINKNATNAVRFTSADEITNLPTRGLNNLIALSAGVVQQGGVIYVRGGRQDEVGYFVEGVQTRNPLFGGNAVTIIDNSIDQVQIQSGGYNAEFGGSNAGLVITSLKSGTEKLKFYGEAITDGWGTPGSGKSLKSYGYSEYVASVSGPVPGANWLRFYLAGNNIFNRTEVRYWDGMNMTGVYDPTLGKVDPVTGAVTYKYYDLVYPAGKILNDASNRYTVNGNLSFDFHPITIKVNGTYSAATIHQGAYVINMFDQMRAPLQETYDASASLHLTHMLSPTTYYEVTANYFRNSSETMDPFLKSNWKLYGDSAENAKYGFTLKGQGQNPDQIVLFGVGFNAPGTVASAYDHVLQSAIGVTGGLVHQMGKIHEFKAGGEMTLYTIRRFNIAGAMAQSFSKSHQQDPTLSTFDIVKSLRLDSYGFDFDGNVADIGGGYSAKTPTFAAAYVQDKMEFRDLVINAGLRFDYIDIDSYVPKDIHNITYDQNALISFGSMSKVPVRTYLSPRLGFAFPVTDRTVFHMQWGKFVQQSQLRDLYLGLISASTNIKGGNAIQNNLGWGLNPERTSQYELGFSQQLGENASFDITAYYKDITDQIQERYIPRSEGAAHQTYFAFTNGDFATTKGIEFKVTLRRTARVMAQAYYSYSDARGTGSNSSSAFRTIWQSPTTSPFFPQYVTPLDFNQTHRGSVSVDYRFGANDGGVILERAGLNLLFTFNSGHNYTRTDYNYGNARQPIEELNASTTPWNFQLDLRLDKAFRVGTVDFDAYVWAINVLDIKNVTNVYLPTGTADDDGYLSTAEGINNAGIYGPQYAQFYRAFLANGYTWQNGAPGVDNKWGTPRQIRVGLRVEL